MRWLTATRNLPCRVNARVHVKASASVATFHSHGHFFPWGNGRLQDVKRDWGWYKRWRRACCGC